MFPCSYLFCEYIDQLLKATVGIEVAIQRLEGKNKR